MTIPVTRADPEQGAGDSLPAWKRGWAVEEGFSLSIDTGGYHFPTGIAFVPEPGPNPKDPLYFVTELRGKVKVVTNDRTVYTFAEDFLQSPFGRDTAMRYDTESGVSGICLEPSRGYVFVAFAYQDGQTLRNNILRFETQPRTFALKPSSQTAFTEVFAQYDSGISHQIGGCRVSGETLYVGVGDGWSSHLGSQRLDTLQGKVIRMTLDGQPLPDNPFYEDDDVRKAANYIWAYGFRNPFSLELVDGRVILAENGLNADRFVELERGRNYLWNGSDKTIATNADYVFLESVGPAQMEYYRGTSPAFPNRLQAQFFAALSAKTPELAGIVRLPYSLEEGRMREAPEYLLQNVTDRYAPVVGLAFGPDGLYFSPLLPVVDGQSAVLKLKYEPENAHPITFADLLARRMASADRDTIVSFMANKGCLGCHRVQGISGRGGTAGPVLGDEAMVQRIQQRVNSPEYLESLQALDARDEAPFDLYRHARDRIADAEGLERVRLWIKYQIMEPRFDGPISAMPNMDVDEAGAAAITRFLLGEESRAGFMDKIARRLFKTEERRLATAFGGGIFVGLIVWLALYGLARLMLRRRR